MAFAKAACAPTSTGRCFGADVTIPIPDEPRQIPARVLKPDGGGPFPAIVLLHDCSGLGPRSSGSPARWAKELTGKGYVVILPDSFSPRGFADGICLIPGNQTVSVNGYV